MVKEQATAKTNTSTPTLSQRDFQLLVAALQSTQGEFKIDYKVFGEKAGFKNANSAKASWHSLKKKLDSLAGDAGGQDAGGEATAESGKGGVKRGSDEEDEQGGEVGAASMKNKKKKAKNSGKTSTPGKKGKSASPADDEDMEGAGVEAEAEAVDED